jgi:hypothetical protein
MISHVQFRFSDIHCRTAASCAWLTCNGGRLKLKNLAIPHARTHIHTVTTLTAHARAHTHTHMYTRTYKYARTCQ